MNGRERYGEEVMFALASDESLVELGNMLSNRGFVMYGS